MKQVRYWPPALMNSEDVMRTFTAFQNAITTAAAVVLVAGGTTTAAAQDDTETQPAIDEIVVEARLTRFSATKSATPIMEMARSVSIETRQQILDRGALNLADAYLYKSGVYGETFGFATRGDWVKVRGLSVPEYRDSLQALFGNYNNTRPDIYTVEQVEILKGPASVLYGQGSPGGIVNVVSKLPEADRSSEFALEYGNFDRAQLAADLTGAIDADGRWLYRLIGVWRESDTQVDFVDEDAIVLAPSITFRPSDDTNITLLANYQATDSDTGAQFLPIAGTLEPAPNGQRIDSEVYLGEPDFNRYDTETRSLSLLADHQFNATWSIEATARFTEGEADYQQAWPSFIGGDRFVRNLDGSLYENGRVPRSFYLSDAESEQTAIDTRLRAAFSTGGIEHEVLMGVQYQDVTTDNDISYNYAMGYDFSADPANWDDRFWINVFDPVYGSIPTSDELLPLFDAPEANTTDLGFYINDHIRAGNWHFTLGLRSDDVETDTGTTVQKDDALSTSVGVLYEFANGLSPYASYAESFQPVVGTDLITNEPLAPREGQQYELGFKYQHSQSPSYFTLAWFDIEESNLPNPNSLPSAPTQQEGVANIQGFEFEGRLVMADFFVELNASRLDTEDPNGLRLASVPEDQASAWIGYQPQTRWRGFKAGLGIRYVGDSWDGADTIRTPSYTLGDVMLGYRFDTWDLALNVRNVADKEYLATCLARGDCFPGERRTVVGRATFRF
jgi:iron complex outermembrane receptor protein